MPADAYTLLSFGIFNVVAISGYYLLNKFGKNTQPGRLEQKIEKLADKGCSKIDGVLAEVHKFYQTYFR